MTDEQKIDIIAVMFEDHHFNYHTRTFYQDILRLTDVFHITAALKFLKSENHIPEIEYLNRLLEKIINKRENKNLNERTINKRRIKMNMNIIDIAKVAHEANKAYCQTIGDHSQPVWERASEEHKESYINGVANILQNPNLPNSIGHESWLQEKLSKGWVYGEFKDEEKKTHPCIVPYGDLPKEQQAKDALFGAVVRALLPLLQSYVDEDQNDSSDVDVLGSSKTKSKGKKK